MAYGSIAVDSITNSDGFTLGGSGATMKNRIINGAMDISQRSGTSSVTISDTGSLTYVLDRWAGYGNVTSKFSLQQSTDAPTGFSNSLLATSLSAYTVGSTEAYTVQQPIEGFNTADLMFGTASASTVTLSFWVKSSLTGTFGGALVNSDTNRSYPYSYTISAANTWEKKSVTIAGDTTGTWVGSTNGVGLRVYFALGAGSSRSGTAGAWNGNFNPSATGAVSVVGTNGATWRVTGVQLEVGSQATSFDYHHYGTELALCQRYYWKYLGQFLCNGFNEFSNVFMGTLNLPTQMRTAPTLTTDASATYRIRVTGAVVNVTSLTMDLATVSSMRLVGNTAGSLTAGQGSILIADAERFLAFSAEL